MKTQDTGVPFVEVSFVHVVASRAYTWTMPLNTWSIFYSVIALAVAKCQVMVLQNLAEKEL